MKKIKSTLMKEAEFNRTLKRLAHEIVEHYDDFPVKPSSSEWSVSSCGKKLQQQFSFANG